MESSKFTLKFSLDSLPTELITEIFQYLDGTDVKSLALTCKRFSKIINSNLQLCDKFTAYFTKDSKVCDWKGCRKYRKAFLDENGIESFLKIQQNLITKLSIFASELRDRDLLYVLEACDNLKDMECSVEVLIESENFSKNLPILELDKLWVGNSPKVFKVLKNCQVKILKFQWIFEMDESKNEFVEFLAGQVNLEELELEAGEINNSLNSDYFLQNIKYNLKNLTLCFDTPNLFEKCRKFVEIHKNSLECLHLICDFPLETFINFENLRDVTIEYGFMDINFISHPKFPILQQVKKLKVLHNFRNDAAQGFPNITELDIDHYFNQQINLTNCKNLQILRISGEFIGNDLKLPKSLKKLTFRDAKFRKTEPPFDCNIGYNLDEIIFKNCRNSEWVEKYLENSKVRILKIYGCGIIYNLRNCKNVEKLITFI